MFLVTPIWQSQIWQLLLLEMAIVLPLLVPRNKSLKNQQEEVHLLIANVTLQLVVWIISGKDYLDYRAFLFEKGYGLLNVVGQPFLPSIIM